MERDGMGEESGFLGWWDFCWGWRRVAWLVSMSIVSMRKESNVKSEFACCFRCWRIEFCVCACFRCCFRLFESEKEERGVTLTCFC